MLTLRSMITLLFFSVFANASYAFAEEQLGSWSQGAPTPTKRTEIVVPRHSMGKYTLLAVSVGLVSAIYWILRLAGR